MGSVRIKLHMNENNIDILLAIYNGERYVCEQIASIFNQSYKKWQLIVRDDGSKDKSEIIIKEYAKKYPERVQHIIDVPNNLGAYQNFAKLLEHSDADYVMFSDQDDVWLPDKVEKSITLMKEMEKQYSRSMPLLVHTDLQVAQEDLTIVSKSFWEYQNVEPQKSLVLNRLLVRSVIRGCTVMINRSLANLAQSIPNDAIMHDHWISLIAAAFGKIGFIREPTMIYRLHEKNYSGGKPWSARYIFDKIFTEAGRSDLRDYLSKTQRQAAAFARLFEKKLSRDSYNMINAYATLGDRGFLWKRWAIVKYGFLNVGIVRNIGMFFFI